MKMCNSISNIQHLIYNTSCTRHPMKDNAPDIRNSNFEPGNKMSIHWNCFQSSAGQNFNEYFTEIKLIFKNFK